MWSDGVEWVRSLCEWLPVPTPLYDAHSAEAARWARSQCDRAEAGAARSVIEALRLLRPARAEARELVRVLGNYLEANLDRMDYPA